MALKPHKLNLGRGVRERGTPTNTGFYSITFEIGVDLLVKGNELPVLVLGYYLCGWWSRAEEF